MNMLGKVMGMFWAKFPASSSGVYESGGTYIEWEKTQMIVDDTTITIIVEKPVESLDDQIRKAIADEKYELADKLTRQRDKGNSTPGELPD